MALHILNFHGNQVVNQIIGKPGIEFDARKFEYIGIPTQDNVACAFTKASGITTFRRAEKCQDAGETRRRRAGRYDLQHREASDCRTQTADPAGRRLQRYIGSSTGGGSG